MPRRSVSCVILTLLLVSPAAAGESLPGIVFVSDETFGPRHEAKELPRPGTNHWREGYMYHRATTQHPLERTTTPTRPGRNLYTLIPAGPEGVLTRITHLTDGEVFDPEPSYDGRKFLFSMRRDGEDWYNLYEIGADGRGLVQLTDGPFNDVSGVYLPDGRIVFVSDRAGYLEEYHEERTETLWTMNADGSGIQQLTFHPGTVFDPAVLADGRILFSLWDTFLLNVPPADKHETYLMTVRPDGTEEGHFFGAGQHRFFSRERHSGVGLQQAGQMPDGTVLVLSELGPSILDPSRGRRAIDALWPVFPCATTVQLGGATHRVHLSPLGSRTTPYPLPDGRFLLAATLPGDRDLGIYVADPSTREMRLLLNDPLRAEFDPRPILLERPRPRVLPPKARFSGSRSGSEDQRVAVSGRARFVVTNARRSDNPDHEAVLHRARYFRVVEALHTAVTSSSHTSLATRVLGEAPILSDGSASFEAPADTPLFLQPVDAAGRRIEFDWSLPETSVPVGSKQDLLEMTYITAGPGEVKSCNGCHAPQHEATGTRSTVAALELAPVSVDRDTTDLLYRRNEPDEYRSNARIGEGAKCRVWLDSPDPDLRRRGCETLMMIEDEGRKEASAIVGLLNDDSPAVRRAAARALACVGSPDALPGLIEVLDDGDWQVRFNAISALEAITACSSGEAGKTGDWLRAPDRGPPEIEHDGDVPVPFNPGLGARGAGFSAEFYRDRIARLGGPDGVRSALAVGPDRLREFNRDGDVELRRRWFESVGRLGSEASEPARRIVRTALEVPLPPPVQFEPWPGKRTPLLGTPPQIGAIRAAGWMNDVESVPRLVPWLSRHEYPDHAAEAALALGRIATPEAVAALWEALGRDVPDRKPYLNRYVQHGPRPEEYSLLRGLILAGAEPPMDKISLIVGLLPGTFLEKPRFEDRLRPESQRVLLGRLLLERARLRRKAVAILLDVLRGNRPAAGDPLYDQILQGINLERPYAEHRRPFPVVERIEPEQALWLLGCLAVDRSEVPEDLVIPYLVSENVRERIDAAVLLDLLGFGAKAADALAKEAEKPYGFGEIMGIGKSHPDPNYRDKCYMAMALAHHADDVHRLETFADPKCRYRDIRYGLAVGLGRRGTADAIELLARIATRDPISAVRREARESLHAIQESCRLAGRPAPEVHLPESTPFEAMYPPRGLKWPAPSVEPFPSEAPPGDLPLEVLRQRVAEGLNQENYRDLNNANNQAPGATHMMVRGMHPFSDAVAMLAGGHPESAGPVLRQLLAAPYPLANYLALRECANGSCPDIERELLQSLQNCARSSDTVKFYWTCEVLAGRRMKSAAPVLAKLAHAESPAWLHGPAGMGHGYPAARAIARLAGDLGDTEVRRLLVSENVWIRAGALAGLAESRAPGVERLFEKILASHQPAVLRDHARVGLARIQWTDGLLAGERVP
ncbi:MAG: HEAT repeat domain-containing protein [Pirellulales bacterium]|nr:HEAT repeat domain-containing protein [Pirellulales bacterium]